MYLDENACHFFEKNSTLTFVSPCFGTMVQLLPWEQHCRLTLQGSEQGAEQGVGLWDEDFPLFTTDVLQYMPKHPISRYAATLPPEVVAALVNYEVDQLSMLQVCAASPRGVQLLHCAPNLLWLVAPDIVCKSNGVPDKIHEMLGRKHKDLLQVLEPALDPVVLDLLAHLSPPQILDDARSKLLRIHTNPIWCDIVRQRKNTSWEMIGIMERYNDFNGINVIRNILVNATNLRCLFNELECASDLYTSTLRLGHALGIASVQSCASRCCSIDDLQTLHDLWAERLNTARNEKWIEELCRLPFPKPPFAVSDSIQPLCSGHELRIESRIMGHCLATCAGAMYMGGVYIYRVLTPERATLELRCNSDGWWNVWELKGHYNKPVSMDCRKFVQAWLWEVQECGGAGGAEML